MPTLIRLVIVIGLVAGAAYAGLVALATLIEPTQREITVTVPQDRFIKQR